MILIIFAGGAAGKIRLKNKKSLYPKIQRRPCRVPLCFVPVLRQKPQRALVKASSAMTGGIRHSLLAHAFGVQLPKCISHARACCLSPPDSSLQVRYDRYFFSIIAFSCIRFMLGIIAPSKRFVKALSAKKPTKFTAENAVPIGSFCIENPIGAAFVSQ